MASARNNRKRKDGRRKFAFLFQFLAIVTAVVALTLGATVFFKVEGVDVVGSLRYTDSQVVEASGIQIEDNLFRLNTSAIVANILEQLPYVESVELRRKLPSRVELTVEEWDAVAWIDDGDSGYLISVGGKLLEQVQSSETIEILGLELLMPKVGTMMALSQEDQLKQTALLALLEDLEERETISLVSQVNLSGATSLELVYNDRFLVKLPILDDYRQKLRALEAAVADREPYETGVMDLTQENYEVLFRPGDID